ncbi:type II membrane protein [Dimargaris verticillata]|uniref:Autophagy-related protein 27 n=1 Tax=Dimargaris verticillata TaxID=2761393 RepID=A0A9W8B0C9_9FUNG|nr:type II membrane protein [Dimargaris verticillata]
MRHFHRTSTWSWTMAAATAVALGATLIPHVQSFACKDVTVGDHRYDLSALNRDHVITRNFSTPPTYTAEIYTVNPCQALQFDSKLDKEDQCAQGTYVCHTTTNYKNDRSRITQVRVLGGGEKDASPTIEFKDKDIKNESDPPLLWAMEGQKDQSDEVEPKSKAFRTEITLICDKNSGSVTTDPQFVQEVDHTLQLEWKSAAACVTTRSDPPAKDPKTPPSTPGQPEEVAQGGGFFATLFKIIGILLLVYVVVGAIYNYAVVGARGLDLIPHRYFWQELPYLCMDFFQYLYSSCSGRSRGGYTAV